MKTSSTNPTLPAASSKSPDGRAAYTAPPSKPNGSKKLGYTRRQLSEQLGISVRSIARAEERGQIRSLKTWRTKLYPHTEVERFLKEGV
jgi:hypothetical protein